MAQLKEALADAKAEVMDEIRELQAAQAELEKAAYDKDNKARTSGVFVGVWAGRQCMCSGLLRCRTNRML